MKDAGWAIIYLDLTLDINSGQRKWAKKEMKNKNLCDIILVNMQI